MKDKAKELDIEVNPNEGRIFTNYTTGKPKEQAVIVLCIEDNLDGTFKGVIINMLLGEFYGLTKPFLYSGRGRLMESCSFDNFNAYEDEITLTN